MPSQDELNQWMQAVAERGDRPAFAALFRHFAPRLKGFLMRGGASEALAEELAQEAMVTLWRRAASYDPQRAQVSTWLFTVLRNLRIDHHRRQALPEAPAPGRAEADAAGDAEAGPSWAEQQPADLALGPDEQLLASQRARGIRQALAQLPPEQAQVLRLSFFDEHPHARIAQELDLPLGTVKSRIRLAVSALRRILDRFEP